MAEIKADPYLVLKHELRRKEEAIQRLNDKLENSRLVIDHLKNTRLKVTRVTRLVYDGLAEYYEVLTILNTYETKDGITVEVQE